MTPPLRPLPPAVRKAFAAYQRRPLDRLSDMAGLSRETGDAVQSFGMGATEPLKASTLNTLRRGIEAWHGSPHKFDKFSLEKIGTGEGAQAYGHGLYFAENPSVAKEYKTTGNAGRSMIDGINTELTRLSKIMDKYEIPGAWRKYKSPVGEEAAKEYDRLMQERTNAGSLYRVRLDVSPDELLDWDKPLAQQSDHVKQALKLGGPGTTASPDWTGSELYWGERAAFSPPQQAKGKAEADSKWLNRLGIPGIKYLDGGSRAAGDGTRNYVIFDPERIQILERLAALGLGGQMVKDMLAKAKAASASQQSQPPTLPPVTVRPPSTPRS